MIVSGDGAARVLSGDGRRWAWDGPWNQQNFTKQVIGFGDLALNDLVCTTGGNSGVHCNIKVTNLMTSINDGYGSFNTIVAVQQTSGAMAAMRGDSGGPVISLINTSSGQVRAAGMIQAGGGSLPSAACQAAWAPQTCSGTVYFTSMRTIVNSLSGVSLAT